MKEEFFTVINCPLCGAKHHAIKYVKKFMQYDYKIVQCNSCNLVFVNPQPDATLLERIYSDDYFKSEKATRIGYTDYFGKEREYRQEAGKRNLELVEKHHTKREESTLLDIGCAGGFFLEVARNKEWIVKGIEISDYAAQFARNELKLKNVKTGELRDGHYKNNEFDVITMFDVIEHILEPIAEMKEISRIMKTGGILVMDTPNIESDTACKQGENFWLLKADHLIYFSPETMTKLLTESGFTVIEISKRLVSKWDQAIKLFPGTKEGSHLTVVARKDIGNK